MNHRNVYVPARLLLDPVQPASAKLLWMALRLEPDAGTTRLRALTGLSPNTIRSSRTLLSEYTPPQGGPRVKVPAALLAEPDVGDQAKVLYGLIQILPNKWENGGRLTSAALSALTKWSSTTVRRAIVELTAARWISLTQKNRRSDFTFRLGTPEHRRATARADLARRRLERKKYVGEALMQEYLSVLVDCDDFADNVRPGWLVNPLSGELLELDRFYISRKVAFEFNGDQHRRAGAQFTQASVDSQIVRDYIKAGRCLDEEVLLVLVYAEDLSMQAMQRKVVRSGLPLRALEGSEQVIDLLERESITYWAGVQKGRKSEGRQA
ncbi:MAG TPA: hypothetical protein VD973_26445 [Symbiobacteriaceae bacterium]|nr:hypothetical protein [Symbiobacteriaceae bacterium]